MRYLLLPLLLLSACDLGEVPTQLPDPPGWPYPQRCVLYEIDTVHLTPAEVWAEAERRRIGFGEQEPLYACCGYAYYLSIGVTAPLWEEAWARYLEYNKMCVLPDPQ